MINCEHLDTLQPRHYSTSHSFLASISYQSTPEMSKTSIQYQLPKKGGQFTLVPITHSPPGPNEISIRTKAVGLNGLDWKSRAFGITVQAWPAVLGVDAAGIVEAIGNEVQTFQPGDEVFSLAGMEPRAGAFQEIFTVPKHFVAKKPSNLTFEEAASLP